jgi:hypothetical protein
MATHVDCPLTPEDIASAVLNQVPQITFENVMTNLRKNPYASLYAGGTVKNFQGDRVVTAVMDRVVTGFSLTRPVTVNADAACGTNGPAAKYGQQTFTSFLKDMRGESPLVCINKARETVEDGYQMATDALRNAMKDIFMAEQRINLMDNSGLKFVAIQNEGIAELVTGGENVQGAPWLGELPNSPMTFSALLSLAELLRYVYNANVETYGEGDNSYFSVITSYEQTNRFRNEAGVLNDFRAGTTGGYNDAKNELWSYAFNPLYRGLRIGIDPLPLRFNNIDNSGNPILIEPYIEDHNVDGGQARNIPNPDWIQAPYEIGFIASKDTFRWRVPERLTSMGDMKWPAQFTTGELQWVDDDRIPCNKYREFGQFLWALKFMVSPRVPHGIIPFAYTRCQSDLGFAACPNVSTGSTSLPVV